MKIKISNPLTVKEVSDKLGVSRQRVHALFKTYGVQVRKIHPRLTIVSRDELKKIPKKRINGVKLSLRK